MRRRVTPKKKSEYRSGFEEKVARRLQELGAPVLYEKDKLKYTVPESKHTYTPDFTLKKNIFIESKGAFTARDRAKLRHVKEQNPDARILILFMRNNYINKGSKTKYSDWAEKYGFEYHISSKGEFPKEWLTLDIRPQLKLRKEKVSVPESP